MRLKWKIIIVTCLLLVVSIAVYIVVSSKFIINKSDFQNKAWDLIEHDSTVIDWGNSKVSIINSKDTPMIVAPILSAKINNALLFLNGGRVVCVEFSTTNEGMLGPIVLYFNPFTRQCIGGQLRM